jgi:hypothetical protein
MGRFILVTSYDGDRINKRLEFQLSGIRPTITIGRLETCDFTVVGWGDFTRVVSRVHCSLGLSGSDVYMVDGDGDRPSALGTYWGTRRLNQGEELLLPVDKDETILAVPKVEPHFRLVVRVTTVSTIRLEAPETALEDTVRVCPDLHELACKVAALEGAIAHLQGQIDELKDRSDIG